MLDSLPPPSTPSLETLPEADVSNDALIGLLRSNGITAAPDKPPFIYATEGLEYPVSLAVEDERKILTLLTSVSLGQGDAIQHSSVANGLNAQFIGAQFHAERDGLWASQWVLYEGGLVVPQFLSTLKRFSSVFAAAIQEPSFKALIGTFKSTALH